MDESGEKKGGHWSRSPIRSDLFGCLFSSSSGRWSLWVLIDIQGTERDNGSVLGEGG